MRLERFAYTPLGTFGKIYIGDKSWYTVERPDRGNEPSISCIQEGCYGLMMDHYNRGGYDAFEILGVPGRTEIKIHIANTMEDVQGCVGVGLDLGYIKDRWAITSSTIAFREFMKAAHDMPHHCKSIIISFVKS